MSVTPREAQALLDALPSRHRPRLIAQEHRRRDGSVLCASVSWCGIAVARPTLAEALEAVVRDAHRRHGVPCPLPPTLPGVAP